MSAGEWKRTEVEAFHDLKGRGRSFLQIRAVAVARGDRVLASLAEDAIAGRSVAAPKLKPVVEAEPEVEEVVEPVVKEVKVVVKPEPVVKPVAAVVTKTEVVTAREAPASGSALAGAEVVLRKAGKALTCQEIVKVMLESGVWKTNGKTPDATLYVALTRDMKKYGDKSPFRREGKTFFV
jgi:hypothetical protein